MEKIRAIFSIVFGGKMSIYRRILRTALWGSLLTFLAMGGISLCGMFFLHHEMVNSGEVLSSNVSTYLEKAIQEDEEDNLQENMGLKAQFVGHLLKSCAHNVQLVADEMSGILRDEKAHIPVKLPVANFEKVGNNTPYLYYIPSLAEGSITPDLEREIAYVSSIEDDLKILSRKFTGAVAVASEHGYIVRMDILGEDNKQAVLRLEPLRSTYDFKSMGWYQDTKKADKLIYTDPYMASYGKSCISVCAPYHDEKGFAGAVVADIDTDYILERVNSADAETAFTFILGRNGEVILSPRKEGSFAAGEAAGDLRKSENADLAEIAGHMVKGEKGVATITVDGKEYYLAYMPLSNIGWSICTAEDKALVMESVEKIEIYTLGIIGDYSAGLNKYFLIMVALASLLFLIVLVVILKANVRLARSFAAPINLLTEGAEEIAKGNLEKKIDIKTDDELETLAGSFNTMTRELALYTENLKKTTAQKERIETEMSVAARIQAGMLPQADKLSERQEFDLAAMMHPAREVGGDFYDFYFVDDAHLAVTVADVSDKGVPAALFMVITKTLLKENILLADEKKLGRIFEETNNALINVNEENMFVTVFTGILDIKTGEFVYVNAGHNPPVLKRGERCFYLSRADSPVLGMMEGLTFQRTRLVLTPGDSILLYTDGVTEARNEQRAFFGENRLLKSVEATGKNAEADINKLYSTLKDYVGEAEQSDDITMLELIYHGPIGNERNGAK